jgi:hypothetical protein
MDVKFHFVHLVTSLYTVTTVSVASVKAQIAKFVVTSTTVAQRRALIAQLHV